MQCGSAYKMDSPPVGFTNEAALGHPGYGMHFGSDGMLRKIPCELPAGHGDGMSEDALERRHRSGNLTWWDPPLFIVGGRDA